MRVIWQKCCHIVLICAFVSSSLMPVSRAQAQVAPTNPSLVSLSIPFNSVRLHGIKIDPKDPLRFDFIVNPGNEHLSDQQLTDKTVKLAKYFCAAIAIPDEDLWVNLSPYEKDRIVPQNFGITDMGRDLLAPDFVWKILWAKNSGRKSMRKLRTNSLPAKFQSTR